MLDAVFVVFNVFSAERLFSETTLKGKLKCNKYIHLLRIFIIPVEEIRVHERLFFGLVIAVVNNKKNAV